MNYSVPEAEPQPTPAGPSRRHQRRKAAFRQQLTLLCLLCGVASTCLPALQIGCTTEVASGDKQQLHLVSEECRVREVASTLLLRFSPLPLIHNRRKMLFTWPLPQTRSHQGPRPTGVETVQIHNPKRHVPLQQP